MAGKRSSRRDIPDLLRIAPGSRFRMRDAAAERSWGWSREEAELATAENLARLGELQYKMYADGRFALLVVLQAIDGGGKDSTIRRVFSSFNPQGCTVTAFKAPTAEELGHDFLWRIHQHTPRHGEVAVFNRSHYEDVLVVRVDQLVPEERWRKRYQHIVDFERMLVDEGTTIIKFFLHISKDEQKKRLEERLAEQEKHWKFDKADLGVRAKWDLYQAAYEEMLAKTSSAHAPWFVIPANKKWYRNLVVSNVLVKTLEGMGLRYPPAQDLAGITIT